MNLKVMEGGRLFFTYPNAEDFRKGDPLTLRLDQLMLVCTPLFGQDRFVGSRSKTTSKIVY